MDSQEQTAAVAAELSYPVAFGVDRQLGDRLGAWWEPKRDHIQPTEFVLTGSGTVLFSTYSNSPVGRMDPEELLSLLRMLHERRR